MRNGLRDSLACGPRGARVGRRVGRCGPERRPRRGSEPPCCVRIAARALHRGRRISPGATSHALSDDGRRAPFSRGRSGGALPPPRPAAHPRLRALRLPAVRARPVRLVAVPCRADARALGAPRRRAVGGASSHGIGAAGGGSAGRARLPDRPVQHPARPISDPTLVPCHRRDTPGAARRLHPRARWTCLASWSVGVTPALLYLLATVDAALCGYRAAAGRSALIRKRDYYRRAMLRGALAGQVAVLVAGVAASVAILTAADQAAVWAELLGAGRRMLQVYLPYAGILGVAFLVRIVPSVDARSLTSTLVFGPFTLLRPVVLSAGVLWGAAKVSFGSVLAVGALVLAIMLSLEPLLTRLRTEALAMPRSASPAR